jgi:hypothetical protein
MNSMIKSDKFPGVFFLNESAQCWAETTVDEDDNNKPAVEAIYNILVDGGEKILILHPDDLEGEENIPEGYEGMIIRYPPGTATSMLH